MTPIDFSGNSGCCNTRITFVLHIDTQETHALPQFEIDIYCYAGVYTHVHIHGNMHCLIVVFYMHPCGPALLQCSME